MTRYKLVAFKQHHRELYAVLCFDTTVIRRCIVARCASLTAHDSAAMMCSHTRLEHLPVRLRAAGCNAMCVMKSLLGPGDALQVGSRGAVAACAPQRPGCSVRLHVRQGVHVHSIVLLCAPEKCIAMHGSVDTCVRCRCAYVQRWSARYLNSTHTESE